MKKGLFMRYIGNLVAITVGITLGMSVSALAAKENPYRSSIATKNAFGLQPPKSPEPEPEPKEEPEPPPPELDVTLTGMATIAGEKMVYFMLPDPENPKQQRYFTLKESEAVEGLEVVNIHLDKEEIQVRNRGREMVLSMKEHGFKVASSGGSSRSQQASQKKNNSGSDRFKPIIITRRSNSNDDSEGSSGNSNGGNSSNSGARSGLVMPTQGTSSPSSSARSSSSSNGNQPIQSSSRRSTVIGGQPSEQEQRAQRMAEGLQKTDQQKATMAAQRELFIQQNVPAPPLPPGVAPNNQNNDGNGQ